MEDETDGTTAGLASEATPRGRVLGSLKGLLHVPEGFDDPLPDELLRAFEAVA